MKFLSGLWLVCILGIVLSLVLGGISYAARPLATDDTGTVETGHFEIEFGVSYQKRVERGYEEGAYFKNVFKETGLEWVAKYGILKNWDVGVAVPYIFVDRTDDKNLDGFQDIRIQTKYRLFEGREFLPSYALGVAIKTQSANEDKGLGSGQVEVSLNNIFSKDIGKFTAYLNLGYNFLTKRKGADDTFSYGLALEYPLVEEKLNLVAEITSETTFEGDFDKNITRGLIGFNYCLTDWLTFDMGNNFGISEGAPEYKVTGGFTLSF